MRRSIVTVSSIRIPTQRVLATTKIMNITKMARHSNMIITNEPNNGATAGTKAKTIIINDEIRAISRP